MDKINNEATVILEKDGNKLIIYKQLELFPEYELKIGVKWIGIKECTTM